MSTGGVVDFGQQPWIEALAKYEVPRAEPLYPLDFAQRGIFQKNDRRLPPTASCKVRDRRQRVFRASDPGEKLAIADRADPTRPN